MNRTRIVATIGPASGQRDTLRRLLEAGMDVARLNFSHGTPAEHRKVCETLRELSDLTGRPIAILQDLAGPKIRVGSFLNPPIHLEPQKEVFVTTRDVLGNERLIPTPYRHLPEDVAPGDHILLHDGIIALEVIDKTDTDVRCRVLFGGTLSDRQGINLPGSETRQAALTDKDRKDLAFGLQMGVDLVALSFVRRAEDIRHVKEFIASRGYDTPVVAKIEKPQAVANIDEVLAAADALMIARGDLGVELPLARVPLIQKDLIAKANMAGKPVITATQMLESMCSSPRPTRAEVSDVANAILDGTDAVMLSSESAAGSFPVESVQTLARIAAESEPRLSYYRVPREEPPEPASLSEAAADAACEAAENLRARAILVFTCSGATARYVARRRPRAQILALTPNENTARRLCLAWGIRPLRIPPATDLEALFSTGLALVRNKNLVEDGDHIVAVAGTSLAAGVSNLVRLVQM